MAEPYILDVDTGIDDTAMLALAARSPEIELLLVSTVAGNVDITNTTENTRRVLSWLGAEHVPVHRGASRPLVRPHVDAAWVHGTSGIGTAQLPPSNAEHGRDRGPAAMIRLTTARPDEITLVCVGPLTNLAIALNVEPDIAKRVKRLVIMGGAFFNPGNVTKHAEFNIYVDPEAADQVFSAPFADVTVIGLDASHHATFTRAEWEAAGKSESKAASVVHQVYVQSFTERGKDVTYLHDALALAIALEPSIAEYATGSVRVELEGERRGKTVFTESGNGVRVAKSIDSERFRAMFQQRIGLEVP